MTSMQAVKLDRPNKPERKKALSKDQVQLAISTFTGLLNGECRQLCAYVAGDRIVVEPLVLPEDARKSA